MSRIVLLAGQALPHATLPVRHELLAACVNSAGDWGCALVYLPHRTALLPEPYRVYLLRGGQVLPEDSWPGANMAQALALFHAQAEALLSGLRINHRPATQEQVVALGRAMDAEDGGYPQPT